MIGARLTLRVQKGSLFTERLLVDGDGAALGRGLGPGTWFGEGICRTEGPSDNTPTGQKFTLCPQIKTVNLSYCVALSWSGLGGM